MEKEIDFHEEICKITTFGGVALLTAVLLVGTIPAVVLVIALPALEDAPSVRAPELRRTASVARAVVDVFIGVVSAVVVPVTRPQPRDALSVQAVELSGIASHVVRHAHLALVGELESSVAQALRHVVGAGMARVDAATIVHLAGIGIALLAIGRKYVDITRRFLQTLHHLLHVGAGVLLGTVHASQLQIRPVHVVAEDGDRKWIDCGRDEHLAIRSVQVRPFDLLPQGIRPIEHLVFVVDSQAAGLRQVLLDDDLLVVSGHRGAVYLAVVAESAPVGEIHVSVEDDKELVHEPDKT